MSTAYTLVKEAILSNIGPLKSTPSGYLKRNCMMCIQRGQSADTRSRFGIKFEPDSISLNCFNCGFSAGWSPDRTLNKNMTDFLQVLGISKTDVKKIQFEIFKFKKTSGTISVPELVLHTNITSSWRTVDLPDNAHTLEFWVREKCSDDNFMATLEYAKQRGLTALDKLYWTPVKEQRLHKRLVIPFFYKGNVVGFTGRYVGPKTKEYIPKYINNMPHGYIYNLDAQCPENKYLIVCEGILDAFHINGVSPLHNTITKAQVDLINSYQKTVILTPHRDKAGASLIEMAQENGWAVSFPSWKKGIKDVSDAVLEYGKILTLQSIIESAEHRKFNIDIKRKMQHI